MSRLTWDGTGERLYETGVSNGVLYVQGESGYESGVAWNGLTAVTESPEGAEATALYADNIKYLNLVSAEDFKCTIEAYTYPEKFELCLGNHELVTGSGVRISQQSRSNFAFCYKTKIGNDEKGDAKGYKLHIVYGCTAAPSEKAYATVNDSPEAITFSFEVNTTPVAVVAPQGVTLPENFTATAHIEIDSTKVTSTKLTAIENSLYGTDGSGSSEGTAPTLLDPGAIAGILAAT